MDETTRNQIRSDVATGSRVLAAHGHEDAVWGHLSIRDPDGRGVWMKGSGLGLAEITADAVVLVGWEGEVLDGARRRHLEYPIHTELMRARADVDCVIHTHPPHAIAFGLTGLTLALSSQAAGLFTAGVPRYDSTARLIDTAELGQELAQKLGASQAALMVNHGVLVVGANVAEAVVAAISLERCCREQLLAASAGGVVHSLTPEQAQQDYAHIRGDAYLQATWEFYARSLTGG